VAGGAVVGALVVGAGVVVGAAVVVGALVVGAGVVVGAAVVVGALVVTGSPLFSLMHPEMHDMAIITINSVIILFFMISPAIDGTILYK